MINLRDSGIHDILPHHLNGTPEVQAISYAITKTFQKMLIYADRTSVYASIDTQPERVLDLLALELRSQYYDEGLPIETKRAIIKNTLIWYQKAGTTSAVEELAETILGNGKILEWFDYGGTPYCFRVHIEDDAESETPANLGDFLKMIRYVKNARSHMEEISINIGITVRDLQKFRLDTLDINSMFRLTAMINQFRQLQMDMFFQNKISMHEYLDFRAQMKNTHEFYLDTIDFFSRFYNLGEGNLLDGRAGLDGSWQLGTISDKGLQFHKLEIAGYFRNHFQVATFDDFLMQMKNYNGWDMVEFDLLIKFLLHQDLSQEMEIGLMVENQKDVRMNCGYQTSVENSISNFHPVSINATIRLENSHKNVLQKTNIGFSVTNSNTFNHGSLIKNDIWYLDGVFSLDGTKNLKTELIEEEI